MSEILGRECNLEQYNWYMRFIDGDTKRKTEFEKLLDNNNVQGAMLSMRRKIIDDNLGKISLNNLEVAYVSDGEKFKKYLEEMFGEYISDAILDYIQQLIKKNGWTMEKLYAEHLRSPYLQTRRILTCCCK